jgi:hypothetical protein
VLELYCDGADRLREVKRGLNGAPPTTAFTATYDGDGLRVSKWEAATGQHDYAWGPGGLLHDSNANTTSTPGFRSGRRRATASPTQTGFGRRGRRRRPRPFCYSPRTIRSMWRAVSRTIWSG